MSVSLTRAFLPALHQNYLYERNLVLAAPDLTQHWQGADSTYAAREIG